MAHKGTIFLVFLVVSACGGESGELNSADDAENFLRGINGSCKVENVRCDPRGDVWQCTYDLNGKFERSTLPQGDHPEVAVIC